LTVTIGGLTRSVRDTARWLDVANGADLHDPHSLPRVEG
jgi:aspartyl-tRNA(Asn)/glutamyl-tRNA(Gln) amidotransferase subunit A